MCSFTPLEGLPETVKFGRGVWHARPSPRIREVAAAYAAAARIDYRPIKTFKPVDKRRARFIAAEFDRLNPFSDSTEVVSSYAALKEETIAQYKVMLLSGLKVELFAGQSSVHPYKKLPAGALVDIVDNNHLWVDASDLDFGETGITEEDSRNPLLEYSEILVGGEPIRFNDAFRAVHDFFGHAKEGVGFFEDGEENAWRGHSTMYSREALPALTTELRGQNSWANFSPPGEFKRSMEDFLYARQKVGVLPEWCWDDGRLD